MAQAPTTKAPATNAGPFSADLKAKLAASQSTMIYVPVDGEPPSDDELKTLAADGLHVEYDAVRDALAVRAATEDEVAAAKAPAPPAAATAEDVKAT